MRKIVIAAFVAVLLAVVSSLAYAAVVTSYLAVTSLASGSTVSGTITIRGIIGTEWKNVRAYSSAGAALSADVIPSSGSFSLPVDTTQLQNGVNTISIVGSSLPPGQVGGSTTTTLFKLNVKNTVSAAAVNGACGSSSGASLTSKPTTNLCTAGTTSAVSGTGPWTWTCAGINSGTTAQCSAAVVAVNGACGSSNGASLTSAPTTSLCTSGAASSVVGTGPWIWTCAGSNSGTSAQCSAVAVVNGVCGSSSGASLTSAPTTSLCTTGTASSVSGTGPWTWTCAGSNSGTTAQCSALSGSVAVNGACGSSSGSSLTSKPTANLCTTGTASSVSGTGPWTWSCAGINSGTTAQCSALAVAINGACGSSEWQQPGQQTDGQFVYCGHSVIRLWHRPLDVELRGQQQRDYCSVFGTCQQYLNYHPAS